MATPPSRMEDIFVFGSNLAGRHGRGAALSAHEIHGAIQGVGWGRTGNAYALPTKDHHLETLPISHIRGYAIAFLDYAKNHPELTFRVTRIGCGLAGYKEKEMRPLFEGATDNCKFDWND